VAVKIILHQIIMPQLVAVDKTRQVMVVIQQSVEVFATRHHVIIPQSVAVRLTRHRAMIQQSAAVIRILHRILVPQSVAVFAILHQVLALLLEEGVATRHLVLVPQ
jgi:hypothetical protein